MSPQMINRRKVLGAVGAAGSMMALGARAKAGTATAGVDIVMTAGETGLTLQQIGADQGIFEKFGIDPNVLVVSDGTKCVAALLSGASQICMWSGFNQVAPAIENGANLKILAGALNLPSLAMYSSKPNIRKVSDLEGRIVGIGAPGAVVHQMTYYLLKKKGVDVDRVDFRNVGSNVDILKAVSAGTVDAGLSDVDVLDQADKYHVHALSDGLLWLEIPDYTNQGTFTSDSALRKDRAVLVRALAAYDTIYRFICGPGSEDAFVAASNKVTGKDATKEAQTKWSWIQKFQPYDTNLTLSDAQINLVQQLNVQFKVQRNVLPIPRIADMSVARDALKLVAKG